MAWILPSSFLLSAALAGPASPPPLPTAPPHSAAGAWIVRSQGGPFVGDDVPVPAVIQRFIDLYGAGKVNEALAMIWDPLEEAIRTGMPAGTEAEQKQKQEVEEKLTILRGMMKWKLSAALEQSGTPKIDLVRSFQQDKQTVRVHLRVRHPGSIFFIRFTAQKTPVGEIVNGISFGDDEADIFSD